MPKGEKRFRDHTKGSTMSGRESSSFEIVNIGEWTLFFSQKTKQNNQLFGFQTLLANLRIHLLATIKNKNRSRAKDIYKISFSPFCFLDSLQKQNGARPLLLAIHSQSLRTNVGWEILGTVIQPTHPQMFPISGHLPLQISKNMNSSPAVYRGDGM